MNPIIQGIEAGYSPEEMLEYISKSLPALVPKITKAMSKGYGIKEILGFLAQSTPQSNQSTKGMSEIEIQNRSQQQQGQLVKNGLVAAGSMLAAPLAANAAKSALSRALPRSLSPVAGSLANSSNTSVNPSPNVLPPEATANASQPMKQTTEQQLPNISQQPPFLGNVNIQQPAQSVQPKGFDTNIIKNGLAYRRQIDALIKSGNGPEEIEAYLKKFNPGFIKTIEKEGKGPFKDVVSQYMQEKLRDEAMQPEGSTGTVLGKQPKTEEITPEKQPIPENQNLPKSTNLVDENPKIEKKSIVSTPNGVGEVKEIRNGQAIVDVDGKLHKVKEEELEASPLPEKELSELYDDLLRGIESETGEDVSRMVQWAGYNPETNTLQFLPHTGKLYKYGNISAEDAALLTDILSVRKSSGENFIGAWKAGSKSPIGAALSKLIRKLQSERGGKGNEYEETHEPIYSAYEPAIQAKKKKKKK